MTSVSYNFCSIYCAFHSSDNPIPRPHEIALIMRIILIVNAILYFLVTVIFVDLFWFLFVCYV